MINSNYPNTQGSGEAVQMPKCRHGVPFSMPQGSLPGPWLLPLVGGSLT